METFMEYPQLHAHTCSVINQKKIQMQQIICKDPHRNTPNLTHLPLHQSYNQKRYTPKRRRMEGMDSMLSSSGGSLTGSCKKEEDALTAIERDVLKKTQQAQQAIMHQQRQVVQVISQPVATTPTPQGIQGGTYIIQQGSSTPVTHICQGQVQQIQLASSNGVTHQQVVHTVHQVPVQTIQGQQGPHVTVGQQQTTTYYTPAPTTFHGNSNALFSLDRKNEYVFDYSKVSSLSPLHVIEGVRKLSKKLIIVSGEDKISKQAQYNATLLMNMLIRSTICSKKMTSTHKLNMEAFEDSNNTGIDKLAGFPCSL